MQSYYDKRDHAIAVDKKVQKIKDVAPKGAKTYIKARLKDLKIVHDSISKDRR